MGKENALVQLWRRWSRKDGRVVSTLLARGIPGWLPPSPHTPLQPTDT